MFLPKIVQCCYSTYEVQQAHLEGDLTAKILKYTHSNPKTLSQGEDVGGNVDDEHYQEVKKKESKNKREEKKGLKNKKEEKKELNDTAN